MQRDPKKTNNVGTVGNLDAPRKGMNRTADIGLLSRASEIHLWQTSKTNWRSPRIKPHSWQSNKEKIYNSFDVLISMSESETFGLTVIEAMSAGIPCLLSPIKAFKQFEDCPGIVISDPDDTRACAFATDYLLARKSRLSSQMKTYFQSHYSENVIANLWHDEISKIIPAYTHSSTAP